MQLFCFLYPLSITVPMRHPALALLGRAHRNKRFGEWTGLLFSRMGRGTQVIECFVLVGTIVDHLASSVSLCGADTPEQV